MSDYTVTIITDVSGHQVVYDGVGPDVPLSIKSDVVRRHIRNDTGACILTESIGTIITPDAVVRSWETFGPFEEDLKAHLNAQIAAMFAPAPPPEPE